MKNGKRIRGLLSCTVLYALLLVVGATGCGELKDDDSNGNDGQKIQINSDTDAGEDDPVSAPKPDPVVPSDIDMPQNPESDSAALKEENGDEGVPEMPDVNYVIGTKGYEYDTNDGGHVRQFASNLFDGDNDTKWCVDFENNSYVYALWEPKYATQCRTVYITSGDDNESYPGRNPTEWALYGHREGEWIKIASSDEDGALSDNNKVVNAFNITWVGDTPELDRFLFYVKGNGGDNSIQISEIGISADAQ